MQGECSEHQTFFKDCVLCKSSLISVAVVCVSCLAIRNILILQLASLFCAVHKHAALEMQPSKHVEGSTRHHQGNIGIVAGGCKQIAKYAGLGNNQGFCCCWRFNNARLHHWSLGWKRSILKREEEWIFKIQNRPRGRQTAAHYTES